MTLQVRRIRASAASIVSVAGMLFAPTGAAGASVHAGRIVFAEPRNLPTIGVQPPPADQQSESAREVAVQYNSSVGTVIFSEEVWDPAFWGERMSATFFLGAKCSEGFSEHPDQFRGEVTARPKGTTLLVASGVNGDATLQGYNGAVRSEGGFDGHRFEISFTSYAFRRRNWRCAAVDHNGSTPHFYLGGWRTTRSTTQFRRRWSRPSRRPNPRERATSVGRSARLGVGRPCAGLVRSVAVKSCPETCPRLGESNPTIPSCSWPNMALQSHIAPPANNF